MNGKEKTIMIEGLCPGIRRTVEWLNENGFKTTDSGDGVSNEGMDCALEFPNVFMVCDPKNLVAEADRLRGLLEAKDIFVGPLSPPGEVDPPHIEACYDPSDGIGILGLTNVDDKLLFGS